MNDIFEDDKQNILFHYIFLTQEKFIRPIEDGAKKYMGSVQFFALTLLLGYGPMNMSELAAKMLITKQQTTQVINKLIEAGYVYRQNSATDQRVTIVSCSKEGKKNIQRLMHESYRCLNKNFTAYKSEDKFYKALTAVVNTAADI